MSNEFEQEYFGFEPQKPITEKQPAPEAAPPQRPPVPEAAPQEAQSFNPIRHTAVYSDNRFEQQPPQRAPQRAPQAAPEIAAAPPVEPAPDAKPQKAPEPKANTALVIVVIVMSLLLCAGMFGILAYSVFQSNDADGKGSQKTQDSQTSRRSQDAPDRDFIISTPDEPQNPFNFQIEDQPQAKEHPESDYSDQIDKNYAGLTLAPKPEDAQTNSAYTAENAYQATAASVVSVLCYENEIGDNKSATSQGSGTIISEDGYLITNSHVVSNSKTAYAIKVVTADGKEYTAGVVGCDSRTDLAVLKLKDAKGLKAATFGDSDELQLGEDMLIIGNPGGIDYQNSLTKGVVSAINRDASNKNIAKYIQTDAAINPGNSGGPAVNLYGQVIGVASAKISNEQYEGMGFCIPSSQTKKIVDSLIRNGYVEGRVRIGITGIAATSAEAKKYNISGGIVIESISLGGPCDNGTLKPGDVITALDGKPIASFSDIYEILESYKPGEKATLSYYRPDVGKSFETEIELQEDR